MFATNVLEGKIAVVTGGGTGIGLAIAKHLCEMGARVVICGRKADVLERACRQIGWGRASFRQCDVRKELEVRALMSFVVENHGPLQILINNAGGQFPSPAAAISTGGWRSVIDLNLTGIFLCCREAFTTGQMQEAGGTIVNVVCDMWKGFPLMSHTGAARAGVVNLTQSLAVEWAGHSVRINAVAPGVILSDTAKAHYKKAGVLFEEQAESIPAQRLGTVDEVAAVACFLTSPGAAYITGETIKVDGGSSIAPSLRGMDRLYHKRPPFPKYSANL